MTSLIPAFVSALLIARTNTKKNTVAATNLQKLYHDTGLSNELLNLISCIEKCQDNELFKNVNTKKKYEDNMNVYSDKHDIPGWPPGVIGSSTATFHRKAYNRKRRDQLSKSRNQYKGCILACIEKFTQSGGSLIDFQGLSSELISYYCPDFVDLLNMYINDVETKNWFIKNYKTMGLIGGRRKTRQKKRKKRRKRKKSRKHRR